MWVWVNALPDAVFSSALEGPVWTPCSRLPGLGAGGGKVEACAALVVVGRSLTVAHDGSVGAMVCVGGTPQYLFCR